MFSRYARLLTARVAISIACLAGLPSSASWGQGNAAAAQLIQDELVLQNGLVQNPHELSNVPDDLEAQLQEHRERADMISPVGLNTGTVGGTLTFNTQDFSLPQLYCEQGQYANGFIARVGKMDPFLIYDGGRYVSPNYAFLSPAFSGTLTMPRPPSALGVAVAVYLTEETYVLAGTHDANGERTTAGFDTFFGEGESFSAIEFGWFPNRGDPDEGLYHFTLWNIDSRQNAGRASDRGIAITLEQPIRRQGNFVPFLRYAYANRGLNGIRQYLSVGFGIEDAHCKNEDVIGFAVSWERPSNQNLRVTGRLNQATNRRLKTGH